VAGRVATRWRSAPVSVIGLNDATPAEASRLAKQAEQVLAEHALDALTRAARAA